MPHDSSLALTTYPVPISLDIPKVYPYEVPTTFSSISPYLAGCGSMTVLFCSKFLYGVERWSQVLFCFYLVGWLWEGGGVGIMDKCIFHTMYTLVINVLLITGPRAVAILLMRVVNKLFLVSKLISLLGCIVIHCSSGMSIVPIFPLIKTKDDLFNIFLYFFPKLFVTCLVCILNFLVLITNVGRL